MADDTDNDDNDDEESLPYKLIVSAIVIVLTPGVEIITGWAPIGTASAVYVLGGIWGIEFLGDEPEPPETE